MVLISIHPFALRKLFLVVVAFLCFSAFCFADPVLMVRRYTIRADPADSLKATAQAVDESPGSQAGPVSQPNWINGSFAAARPNTATLGRFDLGSVISSPLRNPACIFRSTPAPVDSPEEPAALALRKT